MYDHAVVVSREANGRNANGRRRIVRTRSGHHMDFGKCGHLISYGEARLSLELYFVFVWQKYGNSEKVFRYLMILYSKMSVTRWTDGNYFGSKTKNYFRKIDKKLNVLLDNEDSSPEAIESIVKLAKTQSNNIHSITKLVDSLSTNKQLEEIRRIIDNIPPSQLAIAYEKSQKFESNFR